MGAPERSAEVSHGANREWRPDADDGRLAFWKLRGEAASYCVLLVKVKGSGAGV